MLRRPKQEYKMADDKEPKITEVESDEEDSDDEAPQLEGKEEGDKDAGGKNRAEKKNRKALQKLGFKLVTGFQRVTVKKSKSILFVIHKPEVYKSPVGETYVCFGEAKVEDMSNSQAQQALAQAAAQMQGAAANGASGMPKIEEGEEDPTSGGGDEGGDAPPDGDVDLVMTQANCSKEEAIKALKKHKGDVVEAIMGFQG